MATENNLSATRALGAILIIVIVAAVIAVFAYRYSYPPPAPPPGGNPATTTPPVASTTPASNVVNLYSISPSSGPVGSTIVLAGSGFAADDKVLFNGSVAAADAHPSSMMGGRQSLTISVPSSLTADCKAGQACPMFALLVAPRAYSVAVENENGTSNVVSFTVTGAPVQP